MENRSRILCLPPHIIRLILRKLTEKEDRRTCLTVCKLWESIASEDFADVPIKVRVDQLRKLMNDIPYFGHRVISIRITLHDNRVNPQEISILWRYIIKKCPNIMYIYLSDLAYEFLKGLYYSKAVLKKIRDIHIIHGRLPQSTIDVRRIHLKTVFLYRATIATLKMRSGDINHASRNCSGLIKFVQTFPNLTNLRIDCTDKSNVDLNQILGAAPYLQMLRLFNFETITCVPLASDNREHKENTHLTTLNLSAKRLDMISLLRIAAQKNQVLTRVNTFRLIVRNKIIGILEVPSSSDILSVAARVKRVKMKSPAEDDLRFYVRIDESRSPSTSEIYRDHYTHNPSANWLNHLDTMEKLRVNYPAIFQEKLNEFDAIVADENFDMESILADMFKP